MTWFRSDDDLPEHVKADALEAAAGDPATLAAAWMTWLHMGCDCAKRRTDGGFNRARAHRAVRLPPAMVDTALDALVRAGLLDLEGDGYRFHDWADYQPTKEELDADRKANAERQKAWRVRQREAREAKARNAVTNAVTDSVTNAVGNARLSRETDPAPVTGDTSAPVTAPRPVPSRPVPDASLSGGSGAAAVGAPPPAAPKARRAKAEGAPDVAPLPGSLAAKVYAAIVSSRALQPITGNPGDFAVCVTAEGAYPGVDVLAQVLRAGEFASSKPAGTYSDGRAFLRRWLGEEAKREAARPKPADPTQSGTFLAPQVDRNGRPVQPPFLARDYLARRGVTVPGVNPAPSPAPEVSRVR